VHHDEPGIYRCVRCGTPLFASDAKFDAADDVALLAPKFIGHDTAIEERFEALHIAIPFFFAREVR
jgi:SelR domain-containing protein